MWEVAFGFFPPLPAFCAISFCFWGESDDKGIEMNPLVVIACVLVYVWMRVCLNGCVTVSGQIDCYVETQWEQPISAAALHVVGKDSEKGAEGKMEASPQFVLKKSVET